MLANVRYEDVRTTDRCPMLVHSGKNWLNPRLKSSLLSPVNKHVAIPRVD
jgi:hypothetical protein